MYRSMYLPKKIQSLNCTTLMLFHIVEKQDTIVSPHHAMIKMMMTMLQLLEAPDRGHIPKQKR